MGGWTHDPYDAEWEDPNTGRTVYKPSEDDNYCEACDTDLTADGFCLCDEAAVA